jgi:hypothetical protein
LASNFTDLYVEFDNASIGSQEFLAVLETHNTPLLTTWHLSERTLKDGTRKISFRRKVLNLNEELISSYPCYDAESLTRELLELILLKFPDRALLGEVLVAIYLYHPTSTAKIAFSPRFINALRTLKADLWVDGYTNLANVYPNHAAERYTGKRVSVGINCEGDLGSRTLRISILSALNDWRVDLGLFGNGRLVDCLIPSDGVCLDVLYKVPSCADWIQFLRTLLLSCSLSPGFIELASRSPLELSVYLDTDQLSWTFELHFDQLAMIDTLFSKGFVLHGICAGRPAGEELGRW